MRFLTLALLTFVCFLALTGISAKASNTDEDSVATTKEEEKKNKPKKSGKPPKNPKSKNKKNDDDVDEVKRRNVKKPSKEDKKKGEKKDKKEDKKDKKEEKNKKQVTKESKKEDVKLDEKKVDKKENRKEDVKEDKKDVATKDEKKEDAKEERKVDNKEDKKEDADKKDTKGDGKMGESGSDCLVKDAKELTGDTKSGKITLYTFWNNGKHKCVDHGVPNPLKGVCYAAISHLNWKKEMCGKNILVEHNGKVVRAIISDECGSADCELNHVDLSDACFKSLADESVGTFTGKWKMED